jgi:hypothetical protein
MPTPKSSSEKRQPSARSSSMNCTALPKLAIAAGLGDLEADRSRRELEFQEALAYESRGNRRRRASPPKD